MSKTRLNQGINYLSPDKKKRKIKKSKSPKTFIYYSQTMDDVYENLQDY